MCTHTNTWLFWIFSILIWPPPHAQTDMCKQLQKQCLKQCLISTYVYHAVLYCIYVYLRKTQFDFNNQKKQGNKQGSKKGKGLDLFNFIRKPGWNCNICLTVFLSVVQTQAEFQLCMWVAHKYRLSFWDELLLQLNTSPIIFTLIPGVRCKTCLHYTVSPVSSFFRLLFTAPHPNWWCKHRPSLLAKLMARLITAGRPLIALWEDSGMVKSLFSGTDSVCFNPG